MLAPEDGRRPIEQSGFSYLPRFINEEESAALISYFAGRRPLWEQRHNDKKHERSSEQARRLTRPVYWLGAWQFACLGYYAEPHYRENRCVRAEPFPDVMQAILQRLQPIVANHGGTGPTSHLAPPNTCLINYYGRETGGGVPVDYARLRMHRDGEPGPVIMFNIGQAGLLEFLDPKRSPDPELSLWTRHRSVTIISGPDFKDRLYHRVVQVRTGDKPKLHCQLSNFALRRVSVSFRHVPPELICDFPQLPKQAQDQVRGYVEELSTSSEHFRNQLRDSTPLS